MHYYTVHPVDEDVAVLFSKYIMLIFYTFITRILCASVILCLLSRIVVAALDLAPASSEVYPRSRLCLIETSKAFHSPFPNCPFSLVPPPPFMSNLWKSLFSRVEQDRTPFDHAQSLSTPIDELVHFFQVLPRFSFESDPTQWLFFDSSAVGLTGGGYVVPHFILPYLPSSVIEEGWILILVPFTFSFFRPFFTV